MTATVDLDLGLTQGRRLGTDRNRGRHKEGAGKDE